MTTNVDVAVLGGGITGLGMAAECVSRGMRVALIERNENFAAETSDNSLRIIHGGFRYLQSFSIGRVCESIRAQAELLSEYAELIEPLPCLMRLEPGSPRAKIPVTCAAVAYRMLQKFAAGADLPVKTLSAEDVTRLAPRFAAEHGALLWHDALLRHPRLLVEAMVAKLSAKSVLLLPKSSVETIEKTKTGFVVGYITHNAAATLQANYVIDCLGAGSPQVKRSGYVVNDEALQWCRGFNVIVEELLHPNHALAVRSARGRLFFAVPRDGVTAIGTGYLPLHEADGALHVPEHEQDSFLEEFFAAYDGRPKSALPAVRALDLGILPRRPGDDLAEVAPEGRNRMFVSDRYIRAVSGKYTTFKPFARAVVDKLLK